jgi:SET domain-containing protein
VRKGVATMRPISMKETEKYGRGIYATRDIKKGEVLEEAPVIVSPKTEKEHLKKTIIRDYFFRWDGHFAIALGYGSIFNHSYTPNARYITNIGNRSIDFYAMADIREGEEITVNYNGDPKDKSPLWFDVLD